MKKNFQSKSELAKSGASCMLVVLFFLGVILYFTYWPLSIIVGVIFFYWLFESSKGINELEKSGEIYLEEKIELLDLNVFKSDEIPFAVVLDVETTGLLTDDTIPTIKKVKENPDWYPRIVQIAWVTLTRNYEIVEKHSFYIKQTAKIPESAVQIHGITDAICENEGKDLTDILLKLKNSIEDCDYFVGHNVMFDKYVIEAECIRNSIPKPFKNMKKYDTMSMGSSILKRKRFKLIDLAKKVLGNEMLEKNNVNFHDAMSDTWVTASIFSALHKRNIKY